MDRRKFLKQISMWSAGAVSTVPVFTITRELFADTSKNPDIFVAKGKDYDLLIKELIESAGRITSFVKRGDKVVLKPNMGWDREVDQGANTHPVLISGLAELCLDAGASKVSVFDRTCNEERRCYNNSGIKPALKKLGDKRVKCEFIDDRNFVPVKIENGNVLKEWPFYKDALEADSYINIPVAKHHGLSDLTLGIKNIMGVIGGWRSRLHFRLAEQLADLNTVIRPSLTIIDATRILLRNGPQGGRRSDVKVLDTIIASKDPVAADAYATTLFKKKPSDIKTTVEAYKIGLGQMDLNKCNIKEINV